MTETEMDETRFTEKSEQSKRALTNWNTGKRSFARRSARSGWMTDGYYQCDRCGEFEKGPIRRKGKHGPMATDYSDSSVRSLKWGHRTGEDDSGAITRTIDLCEQCRKTLTEWFNNHAE